MRTLKLPTKKHKGMYVYCSKCKKHFSWTSRTDKDGKKQEPSCGFDKRNYSSCKYAEKHKYKFKKHIPNSINSVTTKTFDTKNYNEAVVRAIQFEEDFTLEVSGYTDIQYQKKQAISINYLLDMQAAYICFLENIDVPEHEKVQRSDDYVRAVARVMTVFNDALKANKINIKLMTLERIDKTHVGYFHTHLLDTNKASSGTYNNYMTKMKGFYKWAAGSIELKSVNPFDSVKSRTTTTEILTITKKEFEDLLNVVTKENGTAILDAKGRKKNWYVPYLKNAFELGLYTGGRLEEIIALKWNMIYEDQDEPIFIKINNFKVERQKGKGFNDNVAPKIIPVTLDLKELLIRMGYNEHKGKDQFLIDPQRKVSLKTIKERLSRGFSHYYGLLNTGREITFKHLRKTYLSYMEVALGNDTKKLSSHASNEVLKQHYIDPTIVVKAKNTVKFFE